jgi:hypothetical protein
MRFLLTLVAAITIATSAQAANFSDWAAIVVAGDHKAHDGGDSEVFDNGRHDVGEALRRIGFRADNIAEFSVDSGKYRNPQPQPTDSQLISNTLWDLSNRTTGGCLLYFTSHGNPDGIVVNQSLMSPHEMASIVGNSCSGRPTVVIVAACFSGVFVPALAGPGRFVMTAARPDRASFGCGQADHYTYFDQCFLESIGGSHDFPGLADAVKSCVAVREVEDNVAPPSQPQVYAGPGTQNLPRW